MRLNSLNPAQGARRKAKRLGRGIGSGLGKTCGSGHKGQKSRAGARRRYGFEGGQMPLQRRIPKSGFHSYLSQITGELQVGSLQGWGEEKVTVQALKKRGLIRGRIKRVRIIAGGQLEEAVVLEGIRASKGAALVIEAAGGATK